MFPFNTVGPLGEIPVERKLPNKFRVIRLHDSRTTTIPHFVGYTSKTKFPRCITDRSSRSI